MSIDNVAQNEGMECTGLDYKELYFATMGKLAEICEAVIQAQRDMEEWYLKQTDNMKEV